MFLLAASRSELILRFSAAKDDALTQTLVPALLLAFLSGSLDRSLFLEFAGHAAGAGGVLLCILAACLNVVEELLSTRNFALCLF